MLVASEREIHAYEYVIHMQQQHISDRRHMSSNVYHCSGRIASSCPFIYTYKHTYIHHLFMYIHIYIYTYRHTYIHTYIHTYMHTCILVATKEKKKKMEV